VSEAVTRCVLGNGARAEDLDGRVAVVTGASHGLGAGMASRFVELGLRVAICSRKRPEPPHGAGKHHVLAMSADVRDSSDVEGFGAAAVERFGRIDLWVNNAGVIDPIGKLADVDPGMVAHHISVNVIGVANGIRTFARHVRRRPGGGVLVNISSGAATTVYPGWAAYCASKAAVDRLTAVVAQEEQASGLRVYSVAPGHVDTAMQHKVRASSPEAFPFVEKFIEVKREGRFNTPEWVADAVLELAFGGVDVESGNVVRVPDEWDGVSK
jgi:NAD(P)-dependent dehydrogenase (short-subunit alcohol dehydrogenase family)